MRTFILSLMLLAYMTSAFSQTYLSFSKKDQLLQSSSKNELVTPLREVVQALNSVTISYNISNAIETKIMQENTLYSLLKIKGFGLKGEVGKPALPAYTDLVAVPQPPGLSIQILETSYQEYDNYTIYPTQEPLKDSDTIIPLFTKDLASYQKNELYPTELVAIQNVLEYRGTYLAKVQITPVQYNPVSKKIRCYSYIKYKLTHTATRQSATALQAAAFNGRLLKNLISNTDFLPAFTSVADTDSNKYIIVTTNKYLSAANKFAEWKRKTGFYTHLISRSSWSSSNEVKQAISTLYHQATQKPKYLLILGDHEDVPGEYSPTLIGHYSDLYYCCFGGTTDYTADMARGRISVSTLEEAESVFRKIEYYQNNPVTEHEFYQTGTHCAYFQDDKSDGYEDRRFVLTSEEIRDYLLQKNYSIHRIYETYSQINPQYYNLRTYANGEKLPEELLRPNFQWKGNRKDIKNAIEAGSFYILFRGHGHYTVWGNPYYSTTDIEQLTNSNKLPVVFSINCLNGAFDQKICLAEKFLRHPKGGAVGVIAASETSYSGPNDAFAIGLFDAIWSEPGLQFSSGGIANPILTPHPNTYAMGDVLNQGLLRMEQLWTYLTAYTSELFHYFGDPSMEMYTAYPSTFNQVTVEQDGKNITVHTGGLTDCKITLCSKSDNGKSFFEVANQVASHTFRNVDVPCTISITKHNYIPYFCNEDVYIQNKEITGKELYIGKNIHIGKNATPTRLEGEVVVKGKGELTLEASGIITLDKGFEVKKEGTLKTIKKQ